MDGRHLSRLLEEAAAAHPGRAAVEDGRGGSLTHAELLRAADRVASRLARWGVGRGDRVGLWLPKSIEAVAAIQGITGTIEQVSAIATTIAAAVEQQGTATAEIARNVQQAASGTEEVTSQIARVGQGAGETAAAAGQVLAAAGELSQQAERLTDEVNGFVAGVKAA